MRCPDRAEDSVDHAATSRGAVVEVGGVDVVGDDDPRVAESVHPTRAADAAPATTRPAPRRNRRRP
jgi:hypothetical protein